MAKFQLGILALSLCAYGQSITNISTTATSAQAIINYTAPNSTRCTTAVSQSSSLSPLFPQTDSTKFAGGLSDASFSFLDSGLKRTVVVGQKAVLRGTVDNIPYSLNLGAGQQWFFQISCGATVSSIISFTTRLANLGLSYVDPIQGDPQNPGENLNPWVDMSARSFYTDAQTGVQLEELSLPHDVTLCGAACASIALTNSNVSIVGAGWTGPNFPYAITNNNTSYLSFNAAGLRFWGGYPYDDHSASYSSDVMANLNWAQWAITLSSSGSGDILTGCMSENGVSCDPWSNTITCNIPTTSGTCTFGTGTTQYQGGWTSIGHRFRNGPETTQRTGTATCSGTSVTLTDPINGNTPTNHLWITGTPITINGTNYTIGTITGDNTVTVNTACTTGPYVANSLYWLFKVQSASSHTVAITGASGTWEAGLGPSWPDGGFWGENSLTSINGVAGAPGYLVQLVGLGLYWFNSSTGAVSLIGSSNLTGGGSNGNLCSGNSATWDTTGAGSGAPILYCNILGGSGVLKMTYFGTFADAVNIDDNNPAQFMGCALPGCWTVTTVAPSIDTLTTAFNSQYGTIGTSKGMTANNIVGINQHGELLIRAWSSDSTPGWVIMFDPNKISNAAGCVGGGNPGCVVAAIPEFSAMGANNQTLRAGPLKGSMMNNAGSGIVSLGPYYWANSSINGGGPWQIGTIGGFAFTTSVGGVGGLANCPSNPFSVSGTICSAVPLDGQPYDPTPGPNETGARGEYVTVQPGDYLTVGGDNYTGGFEMVRVMVANMSSGTCGVYSSPCVWVQRGTNRDNLFCGTGSGIPGNQCGSPNLSYQVSAANVLLQYVPGASNVFWNYLSDPNGTSLLQEFGFDSTGHVIAFNGKWIDCCSAQVSYSNNGCVDAIGQCYGVKIDPSANTWNLLTRYTPVFDGVAMQNPPFNSTTVNISGSCSGGGCGNSTGIHPSSPGGGGTVDSNRYSQDSRPFNGFWINTGEPCSATNIVGQLWKIASGCQAGGGILHRKSFPTKAAWGWHPLLDISPQIVSSTSASNYFYCVAVITGDCNPSSSPGDIWFNVPWISFPFSYFPGQSGSAPDISDITFVDASPQLDSAVEFPLDDPSDRFGRSRTLTRAFAPTKVNAPFFEIQTTTDNKWFLFRTRSFSSAQAEAILVKRPQEVEDSVSRTQYSQPSINIPAAPNYAMIQLGTLENGSDGVSKFYCTTRLDNCQSVSSPSSSTPFNFASEMPAPTSCSSGCTIKPSFIPDRIYFWRVVRSDASGNIYSTGPTNVIAVQ